jgi:HAE1 family hydrophobic/amphiphilic exporter-1
LLFSQLLTLYITPVFYIYMDQFQKKVAALFGRRKARREKEAIEPVYAGSDD